MEIQRNSHYIKTSIYFILMVNINFQKLLKVVHQGQQLGLYMDNFVKHPEHLYSMMYYIFFSSEYDNLDLKMPGIWPNEMMKSPGPGIYIQAV